MFLSQSVLERGIPFQVQIPDNETIKAIEDARSGANMTKVSLEELKALV